MGSRSRPGSGLPAASPGSQEAALARQAQGHKLHCRQRRWALKGGKKQKPRGETKLEASCSSGQSWAAAAAFGAALAGLRETSTVGV